MLDIDQNSTTKNSLLISNIDIFIYCGSYLSPFNQASDNKSKWLLRVMNKPLLAYQLEFLQQHNFRDVIIISNKKYSQSISDYINAEFIGDIKPELITTSKEGVDWFTIIKNKSKKSNFILLNGDCICDFHLNSVIDGHIEDLSLLTWILNDSSNIKNQKLNYLNDAELNIYGIMPLKSNESLNRIVYHIKKEKDSSNSDLKIKDSLFKNAKNIDLLYTFEDIGVYIFNKSIFTLFETYNEEFKNWLNFNTEFIPLWISKTYNKKYNATLRNYCKEYNHNDWLSNKLNIRCKLIENNNKNKPNNNEYIYRVNNYPRWLSSIEQVQQSEESNEEIEKTFERIPRVFFQTRNNLKNYFMNFTQMIHGNLDNMKSFNYSIPELQSMTIDTYVADPIISIAQDSRLNHTIAGVNWTLREGSIITSCLLEDNIKIGKECKIKNSFIGDNAIIGDNCIWTDCVIVTNYFVPEGTNVTGKILSNWGDDWIN